MNNQDFTTSIGVNRPASGLYNAINKPSRWWNKEMTGTTGQVNPQRHYQSRDNHCSNMKVIEMVPGQTIAWLVEENYFKYASDQSEWVGNTIRFDISKQAEKTKLIFSQTGLVPSYACYKSCGWAWTGFIQKSLYRLITKAVGQLEWYK